MKKLVLVVTSIFVMSLNAQTFTNYPLAEIGIEALLSDLIIDEQNNIWVVSWAVDQTPGIASFDGVSWQTYGPNEGTSGYDYRGLFQSSTGALYVGLFLDNTTVEGFEIFDGTNWSKFTMAEGLGGPDVSNFSEADNGDIWICTSGGVSRFNGTSFTNYGPTDGLTAIPLETIIDQNGTLWIATVDGAFAFDGTTFTRYDVNDGLMSNLLACVYEDNDGNIWFGGFNTDVGVSRFDGTSFTTFTEITDGVRKIINDSNGNLYFGGESAGVSIYDGTAFTFITEEDGLIDNHVRGIAEDINGNMVFSTWLGVSVYNPTLGIIEQQLPDFKVYPNPTTDKISIETAGFEVRTIEIFNVLGTLVQQHEVQTEILDLSLSNLSAGIYLLKFSNREKQHIVRKLVKQ